MRASTCVRRRYPSCAALTSPGSNSYRPGVFVREIVHAPRGHMRWRKFDELLDALVTDRDDVTIQHLLVSLESKIDEVPEAPAGLSWF